MSTVYIHGESNYHPCANITHFKEIDQDNKQIAMEAKEAIHIEINSSALSHDTRKIYFPEIFNSPLGTDRFSDGSVTMEDTDLPQGHTHLTIPSNRFSRAVCLAN